MTKGGSSPHVPGPTHLFHLAVHLYRLKYRGILMNSLRAAPKCSSSPNEGVMAPTGNCWSFRNIQHNWWLATGIQRQGRVGRQSPGPFTEICTDRENDRTTSSCTREQCGVQGLTSMLCLVTGVCTAVLSEITAGKELGFSHLPNKISMRKTPC